MSQPSGDVVEEVKNRIKKHDATLKIKILPDQLLIGNHSPKLANQPLIIEHNPNGRLSLRFFMAGDMKIGCEEKSFGMAFTQMEQILIKEEKEENPSVIIFEVTLKCLERILSSQPGLAEILKISFQQSKRYMRQLAFVLKPWNNDPDAFAKIIYRDSGNELEHFFDFGTVRSLLFNEIKESWLRSIQDQWSRRTLVSKNLVSEQLIEMNSHQWVHFLTERKLTKRQFADGSIKYCKRDERIDRWDKLHDYRTGKDVRVRFEDPHPSIAEQEKRFAKKRKHTDEDHGKNFRSEDRTIWVSGRVSEISDENELKPTFTKEVRDNWHLTVKTRKKSLMQMMNEMSCGNSEEKEAVENHQNEAIPMEFQHHQSTAQKSEYNFEDAAANLNMNMNMENLEERMRHLGESAEQMNMGNVQMPVEGGDFYQYPQMGWPTDPEAALAEFFVMNSQYPPIENSHFQIQGDMIPASTSNLEDLARAGSSRQSLSTNSPKASPAPETTRFNAETQLFTFPPPEKTPQGMDPVVVFVKDVRTLDRKEFVNDSVITFMINYIRVNMIKETLMSKIHMFNTFFYSTMTRGLPVLCFSQRKPIEEQWQTTLVKNATRLQRWTKKMDLFEKDYIVIPVNEDYHWLLITVFNPSGAIVDTSNEQESRAAPKCYVTFFDPLSGLDPSKRNHMCHCVTTYLRLLYEKTKAPGMEFASPNPTIYDPERVVVMRVNGLPVQDNFFDCGLYILHFIEGLFCYLDKPITVKDFPEFDWSERYPQANEMCALMRDKVYNLILRSSPPTIRSRLEKYERHHKVGLSREGDLRKARRHSAAPLRRLPRHLDYHKRHYSLNPPNRNMMESPEFQNPRAIVEMPITTLIREMRIPENDFPIIY